MADFTVRTTGFRELERDWLALADDLGPAKARRVAGIPLRNALRPVQSSIQSNTPIDTGGLASSIRTNFGVANRKELRSGTFSRNDVAVARTGWFWVGTSRWFQALAVEYGTSQVPARSVLRSALQANISPALNILRRELGANIAKRAARLASAGR